MLFDTFADLGEEQDRLLKRIKTLEAFVEEWADRFGFLAEKHDRRSIESIDEVATVLGARRQKKVKR